MAFEIKRGDRRPHYRIQLTQTNPDDPTQVNPADLSLATAAYFIMSSSTGTIKVNRGAMTFVDRFNGIVEYAWAATDTNTAGTYNVEIEIDWAGEPQTFPSSGYFTITIDTDLG